MGRKTRAARLIVLVRFLTGDVTVSGRLEVWTSPGAKANIRLDPAYDVMYLTLAEWVTEAGWWWCWVPQRFPSFSGQSCELKLFKVAQP